NPSLSAILHMSSLNNLYHSALLGQKAAGLRCVADCIGYACSYSNAALLFLLLFENLLFILQKQINYCRKRRSLPDF
ncbi:hypothetical protein, partial [Acetobacter pasteurianus]|uniref:hypothetical protein n=1 Tax=Acetobacter pasteurianus TaxID=438 RepID=UPI001A7E133D